MSGNRDTWYFGTHGGNEGVIFPRVIFSLFLWLAAIFRTDDDSLAALRILAEFEHAYKDKEIPLV